MPGYPRASSPQRSTSAEASEALRAATAVRTFRLVVENELILAGGWDAGAVDAVLLESGDQISIDEQGVVTGVPEAIQRHRIANPGAYVKLTGPAVNEKLPLMQRRAEAYRQTLKARARLTQGQRHVARHMPSPTRG